MYDNLTFVDDGFKQLRLTIVRPPNISASVPVPVMLHLFAGGFMLGDRSKCPSALAAPALAEGMAVATADYSLCNTFDQDNRQYSLPRQLHEAKAAVRWLRAHAAEYALKTGHIGCMGFSAGGGLCSLLAQTKGLAHAEGQLGEPGAMRFSSAVLFGVSLAGWTDMLLNEDLLSNVRAHPHAQDWCKTAIAACAAGVSTSMRGFGAPLSTMREASPAGWEALANASVLSNVRRNPAAALSPQWIATGESDDCHPWQQAAALASALNKRGVPDVEFQSAPRINHRPDVFGLERQEAMLREYIGRMLAKHRHSAIPDSDSVV